ncbi:MAG: right-handed parallel beta-helix repeat-containing protein, partial [Actinobacteria bacterium]|nr:right-handed parallel beta-helix repeat-containing protein [Actinomycetota bacterium]
MSRGRRRRRLPGLVLAALVLLPGTALAHEERPSQFPSGQGSVPEYRTTGPYLLVCKPDSRERISGYPRNLRRQNLALLGECRRRGFEHVQQAVDAVREPGTRILVLPGVYREEPSLGPLSPECAALEDERPLSYEQQAACPHTDNLIAIFGDGPDEDIACDGPLCGLQIEGTGRRPEDVVIEGDFQKLNLIRADRADGVYFRNFTVQHAPFNGIYVIETDGFAIDRVVGRWTDEYGFLTFASDHGLYVDCEAYGNGDSGIYPGSAADLHGVRPAIEITRCRSHHNALGYSGTAGNSVYVHDNDFYANSTGASMDSFFPDHPGLPQDSATFVNNRIWGNNQDYYENWRNGTCDRPSAERGYEQGVVCPVVPLPVGTGILVAGGNDNLFAENWIFDNWRFGTMLFWVPAIFREEPDPAKQHDTSHFNRHIGNSMGISPTGEVRPNGTDFWWDEEGAGNCWEANVG